MKYTAEEINEIINLRDRQGNPLNVFDLIGEIRFSDNNSETTYVTLVADAINMTLEDFSESTTEIEVINTFNSNLIESIKENLVKHL